MNKTKWILLMLPIILFIIFILNIQNNNSNSDSINLQTGSAPWSVETNNLKARLDNIGLPALSEEGTVLHTHQHLDIFIDSNHLVIPANIGINQIQKFISPIHTHDTTGIIHIESPTVEIFTLGQFFDVWGVKFDDNCIGGYCTNDNKKLITYSNGQLVSNNFRDLKLEPYQVIVVVFGMPPSSIPSNYEFPPDY